MLRIAEGAEGITSEGKRSTTAGRSFVLKFSDRLSLFLSAADSLSAHTTSGPGLKTTIEVQVIVAETESSSQSPSSHHCTMTTCLLPYCLKPEPTPEHVARHANDTLPDAEQNQWPGGIASYSSKPPLDKKQVRKLIALHQDVDHPGNCPNCRKHFITIKTLADHMNSVHLQRAASSWACVPCQVVFATLKEAIQHFSGGDHGVILYPAALFGVDYVEGAPRFYSSECDDISDEGERRTSSTTRSSLRDSYVGRRG